MSAGYGKYFRRGEKQTEKKRGMMNQSDLKYYFCARVESGHKLKFFYEIIHEIFGRWKKESELYEQSLSSLGSFITGSCLFLSH